MIIYKVCRICEWQSALAAGIYHGSADDIRDGFIHFSTADQLAGTLDKHFSGCDDLLLLAVKADILAENLRFEPARDGDLFPHLYGSLKPNQVAAITELPLCGNSHQITLPEVL